MNKLGSSGGRKSIFQSLMDGGYKDHSLIGYIWMIFITCTWTHHGLDFFVLIYLI